MRTRHNTVHLKLNCWLFLQLSSGLQWYHLCIWTGISLYPYLIPSHYQICRMFLLFLQTGSGKTFTITGGAERYADRGIIPRTLSYLFQEYQKVNGHMYMYMYSIHSTVHVEMAHMLNIHFGGLDHFLYMDKCASGPPSPPTITYSCVLVQNHIYRLNFSGGGVLPNFLWSLKGMLCIHLFPYTFKDVPLPLDPK